MVVKNKMGKRGPRSKKDQVIPSDASSEDVFINREPPIAPEHFSKEEKNIWIETVIMLRPLNLLEKIDRGVLAAYCCSYMRWVNAEKQIQKVREGINGGLRSLVDGRSPHALITVSRNAQQDMVGFAFQLGMTPAARIKIQSPKKFDSPNPFNKLKERNGKLDDNRQAIRRGIAAQEKQA